MKDASATIAPVTKTTRRRAAFTQEIDPGLMSRRCGSHDAVLAVGQGDTELTGERRVGGALGGFQLK